MLLPGPVHSPAAWQWITRILAISANFTLEGFFLISLRNSPRATSHLWRGRGAGQCSITLDRAIRESKWKLSSPGAHGRMLVAWQKCLCTEGGAGKTRLTNSPCPTAETAHRCKDRGDGSTEPPTASKTLPKPPRFCGYGGAWDEGQWGRWYPKLSALIP